MASKQQDDAPDHAHHAHGHHYHHHPHEGDASHSHHGQPGDHHHEHHHAAGGPKAGDHSTDGITYHKMPDGRVLHSHDGCGPRWMSRKPFIGQHLPRSCIPLTLRACSVESGTPNVVCHDVLHDDMMTSCPALHHFHLSAVSI